MDSQPKPLPYTCPPSFDQSISLPIAYDKVLQVERDAYQDPRALVFTRVIGYLMLFAPISSIRIALAQEILVGEGPAVEIITALGEFYCENFIRAFKRPQLASENEEEKMLFETKEAYRANHRTTKNKALNRDHHRCLVSRAVDTLTCEPDNLSAGDGGTRMTTCVYIIPESAVSNIPTRYSLSETWEHPVLPSRPVLERLGLDYILAELEGPKVHRLQNVLTLELDVRVLFDSLDLWFEDTGEPNTYMVNATRAFFLSNYLRNNPNPVTFETPDPLKYPLPSTEYLQLHALCAKVAKFSGAGEYIEKSRMAEENGERYPAASQRLLGKTGLYRLNPTKL